MQKILSEQVKAARYLLGWDQRNLSKMSGVSLPTIGRLESQPGPLTAYESTVSAIRSALENAGVEFLADGEASATGGAGVRLKG
jgi:predicted transcriptional regulator